MRDEESVIITSDELQSMLSHNGMKHKKIFIHTEFFCYYIDTNNESTPPSVFECIEHLSQKETPNDLLCN